MVEPTFDRVAFEVAGIPIYWYGMIIAFGALLGLLLSLYEAKRLKYDGERVIDIVMWAIPISIVFARIYYVTFQWDYYRNNLGQIVDIRQGGIAIHGAIFGAVLVVIIYSMRKHMSFWKIADIMAPSLLLGQAIGRWGNFMNQEAHGTETTSSFLSETLHLPDWIVNQMYIDGAYYLPTFLYESLWNLLGVAVLVAWRMIGNPRRGYIFLSYLIWYSIGRFYIEGLRTDSLMAGDLKTAQMVSLILIGLSVVMMVVRRKAKRYQDATESGLFD